MRLLNTTSRLVLEPLADPKPEWLTENREIAPRYFDKVTDRLVRIEGFDPDAAVRATANAFAFLRLCAVRSGPGASFTPSRIVDQAWHAAILFTKDYAELCRMLGKFVHHAPHGGPVSVEVASTELARTVEAMTEERIAFDISLWDLASKVDSATNCCAECSGCRRD